MKRSFLLCSLFLATVVPGNGVDISSAPTAEASVNPGPPPGDPLSQGLWWLYQLQYEKARALYENYIQDHPRDPAGYFYETAADWWQLAQQLDYKQPHLMRRFEEDYEKTLARGKTSLKLAQTDEAKASAYFYLGGAEGLKGRWLVTQKDWLKAYFLGKRGNRYLRRALAYNPTLYDAYLGLGIYDYFTDTLPGVVGVLSDLFIHGDKKRGLRELHLAIEKGDRARVEAILFLIEIYMDEERSPAKALPLAQELHQEFPQSPAMYLALIMCDYKLRRWDELDDEARKFLDLSTRQAPYYPASGRLPAWYCLGVSALMGRHDPDTCLSYMNQILAQTTDSSRWVTFAYLRRAQVDDLKGERAKAREEYRKVLERPDIWGAHRDARRGLETPFSYSRG